MPKLENRNSKIAARNVTPAKAGVYEAVDPHFRGNGPSGGFRISIFAFRFCLLTPEL
jgi:hypothetical protein